MKLESLCTAKGTVREYTGRPQERKSLPAILGHGAKAQELQRAAEMKCQGNKSATQQVD